MSLSQPTADATDVARYPRVVLATVCVPWTEGYEVDDALFRDAIRDHVRLGIRDLYVFGTAGEGYAVTERQFDHVVDLFTEESAALGIDPMVGCISLSTRTIIERIERSMSKGVRRFQFALPGWGVQTDTEVETFIREVVGRFPEALFLHYNLMRTGRLISPAFYARLAQAHPNLVGAKNGTSDVVRIHGLLNEAPLLRHFLTEVGYPFGVTVGRPGLLMSLSSINPRAGIRFFQAGLEGDHAKLLREEGELVWVEMKLLEAAGDTGAHMDGSFEKMMHKVLDERFPLRMLPPYAAVPDEGYLEFRRWLGETYPHWLPDAG